MALPLVLGGLAAYWSMYISLGYSYHNPDGARLTPRDSWVDPDEPGMIYRTKEGVDSLKERFANPFGPYDRMDFIAGSVLLGSTYLVQAAMIVFGPPPVKVVGGLWAVTPMADPFVFGLGVKYNPF